MQNNRPNKHHFLPVFYLKRWAGEDGRVCEFSRPYNDQVKPRRVHPSGTAWVDRLYAIRGIPEAHAQQVEQRYFQPVDSAAAEALAMLEQHGDDAPWDARTRTAWTRFLLSLMLRMPEDVEAIRARWIEGMKDFDAQNELSYQTLKSPSDPATFADYVSTVEPGLIERGMFKTFVDLNNHKSIGQHINNMMWVVIRVEDPLHSFLTSDRCVYRTHGIGNSKAAIILPIGPSRLFLACNRPEAAVWFAQLRPRQLVKAMNRVVVAGACRLAYGADDRPLPFVRKWFGKSPQVRLLANPSLFDGIGVGLMPD